MALFVGRAGEVMALYISFHQFCKTHVGKHMTGVIKITLIVYTSGVTRKLVKEGEASRSVLAGIEGFKLIRFPSVDLLAFLTCAWIVHVPAHLACSTITNADSELVGRLIDWIGTLKALPILGTPLPPASPPACLCLPVNFALYLQC